jgi:S1-C subfamily serine protease
MKSITTGWCRVGLLVLLLVNLSWAVELKGTVMALRGSDVKVDYVQEGKAATAQGDSKSLSPMKSLSTDQVGPNKSGKLKVGWLGAQVRRATLERAGATGSSYGILIDSMEADSPARKAGLLRGDILLEINGKSLRSIRSIHTYFYIIGSQKPGSPVRLEV